MNHFKKITTDYVKLNQILFENDDLISYANNVKMLR